MFDYRREEKERDTRRVSKSFCNVFYKSIGVLSDGRQIQDETSGYKGHDTGDGLCILYELIINNLLVYISP